MPTSAMPGLADIVETRPGFDSRLGLFRCFADEHSLHLGARVVAVTLRDDMGHESIAPSNIYIHSEDEHRHDKTDAAHRLNWDKSRMHRPSSAKP